MALISAQPFPSPSTSTMRQQRLLSWPESAISNNQNTAHPFDLPTSRDLSMRASLIQNLEQYFAFAAHATNWRTEILAGFTTFITMAYIIFVNPAILSETGIPLALAPGMGLNAYFTYTVVKGMGVPWQTALGAVFLSGIIFLILTIGGIRQRLVAAIPHQLHAAVGGGIGLFIAFIGFRNAGIIVPSPTTTVTLGNLHAPATVLALVGLLIIAILQVLRVRASILIGVLTTTLLGVLPSSTLATRTLQPRRH